MTRLISLFLLLLQEYGVESMTCHGGFLDPQKSLNIGQNWGHDLPAGVVHIDLQSVTRPYSAFELRTFDPEGVLIFGDTDGGKDWFLLGLRDGRPEIQIHNQLAKVTINGGPRINDGTWHKVMVRSEDHRIVLEVDGEPSLRIGHVTERVTPTLDTIMRISVGGILINRTELLEPINSAMDGCIRNWVWLSLTPEWSPTHDPSNSSKYCFTSHHQGSYFSGSGKAEYRTRDLGLLPSEGITWSLKIEFGLISESPSFSLLSVLDATAGPLLTLSRREKTFTLELGNMTSLSLPVTEAQDCEATIVTLEVNEIGVRMRIGSDEGQSAITETTYNALREAWMGQAILQIGSDPYDADHFHGCLQNIRIQGKTIDLDFALFRSDSIWAHSCPRSASDF